MMDEYLQHYKLFNEQKINIQSGNPLYTKCNDCETDKSFNESNNELSISCGDKDDTNCGEQFKVIIPTYIHKDKSINELKDKLKSSYDNSGLNYKVLYSYNLIDSSEKGDKFVQEQKNAIKTINEKYIESLGDTSEKIKEFYANRMNLLEKSRNIMNTIKTTLDDDELVKEKRKEYFGLIKQLNNEYLLIHKYLQNSNEYLIIEEPDVEIINENYRENIKSNKSNKKKNKSFVSACDKIMCPEKIYDNKDFKKWAVKNHPDKKKGNNDEENEEINAKFQQVSNCRDEDKFCSQKKENLVPIPKKKKKKQPKEKKSEDNPTLKKEKETKPTPELTKNDFKINDKVEWKKGKKTITGTVVEIDQKTKKKKCINVYINGTGIVETKSPNELKIIN